MTLAYAEDSQCKQIGEVLHYAETVTVELITLSTVASTVEAPLPGEILKPSISFTHLVFLELGSSLPTQITLGCSPSNS